VIQEFKDFINKGGAFEAAVGLVLALAFKPIVDNAVEKILMPFIAAVAGQPNFDDIGFHLGRTGKVTLEDGTTVMEQPFIGIGFVITATISFLLIAATMFLLVKVYNKTNSEQVAEEKPSGPSDNDLLVEIRDALSTQRYPKPDY